MKIRILTSAFKDLADGRRFYERQGENTRRLAALAGNPGSQVTCDGNRPWPW